MGFIHSEMSMISYSITILANLARHTASPKGYQRELVRSSYSRDHVCARGIHRIRNRTICAFNYSFFEYSAPKKAENIWSSCSKIVSLR